MSKDRTTLLALLAAAALALPAAAVAENVKIHPDTFGGLEARSIGPAAMSGRISAINAVVGDRIWANPRSEGVGTPNQAL